MVDAINNNRVEEVINFLAENYKYQRLEDSLSLFCHDFYLRNLPVGCAVDGRTDIIVKTKKGAILSHGYKRVVIGDYGAYLEFTMDQSNRDFFKIKRGQEYRFFDPYKENIKYQWYTIYDGSNIKIYFQQKRVSYADYWPGYYYVAAHDVVLEKFD